MPMKLWLASGSPRRREILADLGIPFAVCVPNVDESVRAAEEPRAYVARLAHSKAAAALESLAKAFAARETDPRATFAVLAADTTVVCDRDVLGKPESPEQHSRMLARLSGRAHDVLTGVCIARSDTGARGAFVVATSVRFRTLSDAAIAAYVASGEGNDKAGGYAVQGMGSAFVQRIEGSYSNVVGLPASETVEALLALAVLPAWPLPNPSNVVQERYG